MHLGRIIPNKHKHRLETKIKLNRAHWDNIMLLNMSISCIQYIRDTTTDQRKIITEGYHDNNRHKYTQDT